MLQNTAGTAAQTQHVLFDSWFSSPKSIREIKHMGLGYDVVARLKNTPKHHYIYQDQKLSISQIFKMNKCRRGRSRYLQSVDVSIAGDEAIPATPARIVYVRNRNKRKDWLAILSTDMSLTPDEIVTLYAKRWDIEPFHRVLKSNLKLEKGFQVRSFDAIVAHASLVVVRYLFLAVETRESIDERSVCQLFWFTCQELADISFEQAIAILVDILQSTLTDVPGLSEGHIQEAVSAFFDALPPDISQRLASYRVRKLSTKEIISLNRSVDCISRV